MVRPIDMQLTMWKVEQQAQQDRDPGSAAAQVVRQDGFKKEVEARDRQVRAGDESGTENRVKPKKDEDESSGRRKKQGKGRDASPEPSGEETKETTPLPKKSGCDFYA